MTDWSVAPGPASVELASKLAKVLGADLLNINSQVFFDGETKLTLDCDVRDKRVIMVQSMYPPVDTHLVQALSLAHRLSEDGAQVFALIPYLGYSRQDSEFLKGEIVTLGIVAHLLRSVGIKRLVTVDIHSTKGLGYFTVPAYSVSAVPLLGEYFRNQKDKGELVAVAPDLGASMRVEAFAKILDIEHLIFEKVRNKVSGEVTVLDRGMDLRGKRIIIVDDMISTGGTIRRAAATLLKNGAEKLFAACVHPVLVGDALDKILESGVDEVVATNTIPSSISKVDVASPIAEYFKTL